MSYREDEAGGLIRELNDACRTGLEGCRIVVTRAVRALGMAEQFVLLAAVRSFDAFNEDNDPHGERDFGAIDLFDARWFWKIDYYNLDLSAGSEDPSDPSQTCRVLTILRSDEY